MVFSAKAESQCQSVEDVTCRKEEDHRAGDGKRNLQSGVGDIESIR